MKELADKYAGKLVATGLADNPLVCGLDDEIIWNREDENIPVLRQVMGSMNINSLICSVPAEPYQTILRYLAGNSSGTITPRDCETRTFLHDLPVTQSFSADAIIAKLHKRKSVIIDTDKGIRVVTFGSVSPEQAFVTFSSVCFSSFVLFFFQYLAGIREGACPAPMHAAFDRAGSFLAEKQYTPPELETGPFTNPEEVRQAIIRAGRMTVQYGLVDSYFGNISYRLDDTIYISQTGSSLDELAGCIDPCPLDGSSSAGITASSELTAHNEIFLRTDNLAILHGHPKFTVILSMDCQKDACPDRDKCHLRCPEKRLIGDIPIVPGEVGTGPTGLCHTLPPAVRNRRGAIVWGHGLFTVAKNDFNDAFKNLLEIENMCRGRYFELVRKASG